MATVAATPDSFSIGRFVSRTFGAVGQNIFTFLPLSLLSVSPILAIAAVAPAAFANGAATPEQMKQFISSPLTVAIVAGALFLYLIFYFVLQAALVKGTVSYLNGQRASFGDCLSTGLGLFFPIIGISILVSWGIVLGFILLIVPGFMLAMRWIVSVPVRVMEGPGILSAMGRSADLTRGHRWPIFGIVVIFFLAQFMLQALAAPFAGGLSQAAGTNPIMMFSIAEGVNFLVSAVVAMFTAAGIAAIYYELRSIKEGIGPEHLAEVFN